MQSSHVKQTLALNSYPRKYFCDQRKVIERSLSTLFFESFTWIPYIQAVSGKIQHVLIEVGQGCYKTTFDYKTPSFLNRPFK